MVLMKLAKEKPDIFKKIKLETCKKGLIACFKFNFFENVGFFFSKFHQDHHLFACSFVYGNLRFPRNYEHGYKAPRHTFFLINETATFLCRPVCFMTIFLIIYSKECLNKDAENTKKCGLKRPPFLDKPAFVYRYLRNSTTEKTEIRLILHTVYT